MGQKKNVQIILLVSAPEALSITKALSLLQAPEVPQTLAESVCADARQIVANSSPTGQEIST